MFSGGKKSSIKMPKLYRAVGGIEQVLDKPIGQEFDLGIDPRFVNTRRVVKVEDYDFHLAAESPEEADFIVRQRNLRRCAEMDEENSRPNLTEIGIVNGPHRESYRVRLVDQEKAGKEFRLYLVQANVTYSLGFQESIKLYNSLKRVCPQTPFNRLQETKPHEFYIVSCSPDEAYHEASKRLRRDFRRLVYNETKIFLPKAILVVSGAERRYYVSLEKEE